MIKIKTSTRLHMALIDMNGKHGRMDGGAGLAIDEPGICIRAKKSDIISISGDPVLEESMKRTVRSLLPSDSGIEIEVIFRNKLHIGLGVGTQSLLAVAKAVNDLYNLEKTVPELSSIAGRGGTSGIGTHSFERGGFIVDGGHKTSTKSGFAPSSVSKAYPAPLLFRHDFPDWHIILAIPEGSGLHGNLEASFFKENCPVPLPEVFEVSHTVLMQLMPAVIENDIEAFGLGVDRLQNTGFNKREIALQPEISKEIMKQMRESGSKGAGLSSFGPVIYGFSDSKKEAQNIANSVNEILGNSGKTVITKARNSGASVTVGNNSIL
ncbi:MAG: beta-ribofuranosylaminobenzene 5'-phosphate synthase [Methanosarcinaceae archaeon]|nr:beta-ribofuranosylaminobenzene 5'-phosphate synthase [Methanosarcinaceae archaeon]